MSFLNDKNPGSNNGRTLLHIAAMTGHLNVCKFIVDTTRNKHPKTVDGCTPLDMALQFGQHKIIEYLSN